MILLAGFTFLSFLNGIWSFIENIRSWKTNDPSSQRYRWFDEKPFSNQIIWNTTNLVGYKSFYWIKEKLYSLLHRLLLVLLHVPTNYLCSICLWSPCLVWIWKVFENSSAQLMDMFSLLTHLSNQTKGCTLSRNRLVFKYCICFRNRIVQSK